MHTVQRVALTSGEPAGIGPDICIQLCLSNQSCELVVIADPELIIERAAQLNIDVRLVLFDQSKAPQAHHAGSIIVLPVSLKHRVSCGQLNVENSAYVIEILEIATQGCIDGLFNAMVTAPVHKAIINDANIPFSGHTEFIANITGGHPVMMLATPGLRVALVTTHLPLSEVSAAITVERLTKVISVLDHDLRHRFGLSKPSIFVCGLNPHAGENGHLGREELDIINPLLDTLITKGMDLHGPFPADTLFTPKYLESADAILAMYHDQGLPALKHKGFGLAVNITLGLPIIRTSVDHGTALDLAGSGQATHSSLQFALKTASQMAESNVT